MFSTPKVTKFLLLSNLIIFLLQQLNPIGSVITTWGSLHYFLSDNFIITQLFTYMFLHGNLNHLFLNMFALWMFGRSVEYTMGTKRFITFYLVCGVGAGLCQELWQLISYHALSNPDYGVTVGASGAIFGILLAFGMIFPNQRIFLLIPPIPLKAKYLVFIYMLIELFSITSNDGIAHVSHLGGMLFGFILILYWKKQDKKNVFYGKWHNDKHNGLFSRFKIINTSMMTNQEQQNAINHIQKIFKAQLDEQQKQQRINAILDKINEKGYDSLSREEKDFLFENRP